LDEILMVAPFARMLGRAPSSATICAPASVTPVIVVSIRSSGRAGASYGASMPVKPVISPARARA